MLWPRSAANDDKVKSTRLFSWGGGQCGAGAAKEEFTGGVPGRQQPTSQVLHATLMVGSEKAAICTSPLNLQSTSHRGCRSTFSSLLYAPTYLY